MGVRAMKVGCPLPTDSKTCVTADVKEIPIEVTSSSSSQYLVVWNLDGRQVAVERFISCPDEWMPHMRCGAPMLLDEPCNTDYVFFMPGQYRLSMTDGEAFPEGFRYELVSVSRETVELYFAERRACCCG